MRTRSDRQTTLWFATLAVALTCQQLRATDYHVATAQDLQTALSLAAASTVSNNIYMTNGYYGGNFNYNCTNTGGLTLRAEPGVAATQIIIDGLAAGRDMTVASTGAGTITVQGMTFLRNCGSTGNAALRIAAGTNAAIVIQSCEFLSPPNTAGIGLELDSGLTAAISNCVVTGLATNNTGFAGTGILVSGITGTANIQNCTVSLNNNQGVIILGTVTPILTGNTFVNNVNHGGYYNGGAVFLQINGTATLSGNLFTGNFTSWAGGAVAAQYGNLTLVLSSNIFTGNGCYSSFGGGAVFCYQISWLTLIGNTFAVNNNSGYRGYGGAVYCTSSSAIVGNSFLGNGNFGNSASAGGAVYCNGGNGSTYTISGNIFETNYSGTAGGAVSVTGSTVTFQDNFVAKNSVYSAAGYGGGIWVDATSNLLMVNNTITGNTSSGSGGGVVFNVTGTVELLNVYNNIIWGNLASQSGGDVWLSGTGQKKVFANNDADSLFGVWDISQNNIDVSPNFFDPINGDYHTQGSSPCIGAGTTNAPSLPATDLDGNPRISNGAIDIGCYQFTTNVFHPADTDHNWVITPAEFAAYAAAWKSAQPWTNGPSPILANYLTRAGYLMTNNNGAYYNDGSARPVNWKTNP